VGDYSFNLVFVLFIDKVRWGMGEVEAVSMHFVIGCQQQGMKYIVNSPVRG